MNDNMYNMAGGLYDQTTGGYNSGLNDLLKVLGNNKGIFGLPATAETALFDFAGGALEGVAGLIAGKSDTQKTAKSVYNLAKNRIGQDVLDPNQYLSDYMRASQERIQNTGERLNQRFGLDSGTAQGALYKDMESGIANFMLQAKQQNDVLKSQNDNMLLSLMGQLSQYV